ncbi:Pumilio-family RNA binding repeat-containing protein [Sporobolomyces salmoneus]|uniref:Pumilio-family RNA binding repeat-containing protein n=1 Tax=Sporobolomyces salmoneus TaxID=183962 RepID=UPI003171E88D
MDTAPAKTTTPIGVNPRHLGLPRRQSYDPLSSTKGSLGLSLGQLPPPAFGNIPAGLRSVPAVESSRHFGSAFRNHVTTPNGDGQRTPGGSLVIGAEVFGFGAALKKEPRERWGTGSIDSVSAEKNEERSSSDWPSAFEKTTSGQRSKHASFDYTSTGLPPPTSTGTLSSAALRSPSPSPAMDDSLRVHLPTHSAGTSTSSSSREVSPTHSSSSDPTTVGTTSGKGAAGSLHLSSLEPRTATEGGGGISVDLSSSPSGQPYVYPFQPPDPSPPPLGPPYFQQFSSMPQPSPEPFYNQYGPGGDQFSPDDLAFGVGRMNLGNGGAGGKGLNLGGRKNSIPHVNQGFSSDSFGGNGMDHGPRGPPTRQNSNGFQPQFLPSPASPYLSHPEPYSPISPFGPPPPCYASGGLARRDSIQVPGWGLPMPPFGFPPDFTRPGSAIPSRQGSFSYAANGPQPSGLSAAYPPPPPPLSSAPSQTRFSTSPPPPPPEQAPIYGNGGGGGQGPSAPQFGQQHQIITGRTVRGQEYIAPGPAGPGYVAVPGFAPVEVRHMRSPLLEEFRMNRVHDWGLAELAGHIVEFSGDQLGSRHIQTKLDFATTEEKAMVFQEILPSMLQLSTDVFANYVIQKFFEKGDQAQRTAMAKVLEGHVLPLSLQMYGCRVIQKALEFVLVDQQVRLVRELEGHVIKCARDAQSNHVVQRALERVPPEHLFFVTDACLGEVHGLATHPYGCRVLQRIFENCPTSQSRALLDELHRFTQQLVQDQYGNYVIQWVIEKGETIDRSHVISVIYGQVLALAHQKFASNVVEKCIMHGTPEERRLLIDELLTPAPDGSSAIKSMLSGAFSNYVVQQALRWSVGSQREAVYDETAIHFINLRKYSTANSKHLITIEKLLQAEGRLPY